jgi:hypothetical protein
MSMKVEKWAASIEFTASEGTAVATQVIKLTGTAIHGDAFAETVGKELAKAMSILGGVPTLLERLAAVEGELAQAGKELIEVSTKNKLLQQAINASPQDIPAPPLAEDSAPNPEPAPKLPKDSEPPPPAASEAPKRPKKSKK